jgi:hypothetical protein
MKCQNCQSNVLPNNPLDENSDWKCQECQMSLSSSQVSETVKSLLEEKEKLPRTDLQVRI